METQRDINYNTLMAAMSMGDTEFAPDDYISKMPSTLKTNILNRLPIQEAVRTSVLSKIWRQRWATITEWVFDDRFINYLSQKRCMHEFYMTILNQMFFRIRGPVTKFVLYTPSARPIYNLKPGEYNLICGHIIRFVNAWVQYFCNMGNLNELVVVNMMCQPLILKSLVFGFEDITRLQLHNCKVKLPPYIYFPNLLRLEYYEHMYDDRVGEVIKKCPLLEDLRISEGALNAEEIVGLQKLKILHLFLYIFRSRVTSSNIYTLLHGLPKLEEVHLNFWECRFLVEAACEGRFTATFPCLNSLSLVGIDFTRSSMILWVCELIRCSPHLQNLSITVNHIDDVLAPYPGAREVEPTCKVNSSTMGRMKMLRTVELNHIRGSENEMNFIRCLLAHAKLLEKLVIRKSIYASNSEEIEETILKFRRASKVEFL